MSCRSHRALISVRRVKVVSLRGHSFDGPGGCALIKSLATMSSLTELRVDSCGFGVDAAVCIGDIVRTSASLAVLELASCGFGAAGGKALADGLAGSLSLKELRLRRCNLGEESALAIGQALAGNPPLVRLDLCSEALGEAGCGAILAALGGAVHNTTLRNVRLWQCGFGDAAAAGLKVALESNTTLAVLCLSCECMTDEGASAIAEGLHASAAIQELRVPKATGITEDALAGSQVRLTLV